MYATALWIIGRHEALATVADPNEDVAALENEISWRHNGIAARSIIMVARTGVCDPGRRGLPGDGLEAGRRYRRIR